MSFIARQPNGLLCRHSSVVDCITDYNMTEEEYISLCIKKATERAKNEAEDILKNYVRDMDLVKTSFSPNNISEEKFKEILIEMEKTACECKHSTT